MKNLIAMTILFSSISAFAYESTISTGDRVNFQNFVGTAVEVFSNGTVKIDVDDEPGYVYRTARKLGKRVKCHKEVCTGSRVNFNNYVGTAKEVFDNGTVKIDIDGYPGYEYKKVHKIGVGYRCSDKLCKGDRVNFGKRTGIAKEIFNNGNVKIDVDGEPGYAYRKVQTLGYNLDCHN